MCTSRLHIWKPQIPCTEHICKLHIITTKQCHNLPTQQLLIGFITKVKCAYCAVRTKSLSIIRVKFDRRSDASSVCSQHTSTKVTTRQLTKTILLQIQLVLSTYLRSDIPASEATTRFRPQILKLQR